MRPGRPTPVKKRLGVRYALYIEVMNKHLSHPHHRADLVRIATRAMTERGLEPEFSKAVERQLATIDGPNQEAGSDIHDLTHLL